MSSTALAIPEDKVPAHIKKAEGVGRGNENVGNNVTIPRVKLLQKMSDEVDKHHASYVKGAEPGHFLNTLTDHNYGEELYAISITFKHEFTVWRKRDAGGGLLGSFSSQAEAQDAINAQDKPQDYDITETHTHVLLLKDPETGNLEPTPVIMDFASSKLRISRNWNSQIGMKGGDRFSGLWKIKSVAVENRMGNAFMNVDVEFVGWAQEEDYKVAEALYEQYA
jgi:predicted transcriptional regulator